MVLHRSILSAPAQTELTDAEPFSRGRHLEPRIRFRVDAAVERGATGITIGFRLARQICAALADQASAFDKRGVSFERFVRDAVSALPGETRAVHANAERLCRQEVDALGRFDAAHMRVDDLLGDGRDSDHLTQEEVDDLRDALRDMAALALSQLALLREQHPDILTGVEP